MTQFVFLNSTAIPLKEGASDFDDPNNLDFATIGRKVAKLYFQQGKCFRIAIHKNEDRGVNLAGHSGDYVLTAQSVEPTYAKDRVIDSWTTLGVVTGENLYEAILPPWFFEETRDSQIGWGTAVDIAEREAQTRHKLLDALNILNSPHLAAPQVLAKAAHDWRHSGFWMCFNHRDNGGGIYILDNRHNGTLGAPVGHKLYPFTSILAGTFRNKKVTGPSDLDYIKDCLTAVKNQRPATPADEYMVGDAYGHLQSLRHKTENAFLARAFLAHGHIEQAMAFMPVVNKQGHYERFKALHDTLIQQLAADIGQIPEESHWDLINEMKSVLGAAAANDCSDDETEQDEAISQAEVWVTNNCSPSGIEEDVAMALWLRGMTQGESYLRTENTVVADQPVGA